MNDEFWGGPEAFKSRDPLPQRRVPSGQQRILRIVRDRTKTHPEIWTFYGETRRVVSIFQRLNHTVPCRTYAESRLNTHTHVLSTLWRRSSAQDHGHALQQVRTPPAAASNLRLQGLPIKPNRRNYGGPGKHTERQIWDILACSVYSPPK